MLRVRRSGRRGGAWAVWLGLLALVLNALVPVHLAFDLAGVFGAGHRHGARAEAQSAEWRLLALLTGHREADGRSDRHGKDHQAACPVCQALGALAGFVPAAPATFPTPAPLAIATPAPVVERAPPAAPLAAYRSRAPPLV